jgi:acetolactate synthase I/III small subunit
MSESLSTIIVWVQNNPGVLFKLSGLIRRRRFNIESLTVSHTEALGISRFTILVNGDKKTVEKMSKQLYRIVEVVKIRESFDKEIVARELCLIKVDTSKKADRMDILETAKHFRAKVVQVKPEYTIFELTGDEEKIDAFYENMKQYGIMEFVRTGRTAVLK